MFELIFYRNRKGYSAVVDYIMDLSVKATTDKESRIIYLQMKCFCTQKIQKIQHETVSRTFNIKIRGNFYLQQQTL